MEMKSRKTLLPVTITNLIDKQRFRTSLFSALAASVSLLANPAQAWTFTTTGIIDSGYDYTGVFFAGSPYATSPVKPTS
jgi:hypothetical protein